MKLDKSLILPVVIFLAAAFAFSYGISSKFEPLMTLMNAYQYDTTITEDSPPPAIKDMSSMFNERGFYTSNGVSFDESEMINDFNGNLMYEIPLYDYKLAGEMKYEVKLVYNSAVGHQVNLGNKNTWITQKPSVYNFNAPEWIISLNGIAVQVLNFEPNFFSKATTTIPYTIKDYNLNLLIPGYHFDNANKILGGSDRDIISILAGDGSTISLVNKSWNTSDHDSLRYIGAYHSEGKGSQYKAVVSFLPDQGSINPDYRNRRVELLKGDGMVFVFQEFYRDYKDLVVDSIAGTGRRPQTLLLMTIKDRFGYNLDLAYNFSSAPSTMGGILYGRPLLIGINSNLSYMQNANIALLYSGSKIKTLSFNDVNKNYTFDITQSSYFFSSESNIGSVTRITNPMLQNTLIEYQPENYYVRELKNVIEPIDDHAISLIANMQRRMSKFTNHLGGSREYTYFPNSDESKNRKLSITMNVSSYNISTNTESESNYMGYGREPFYTSMILLKKEKNGNQYKNETIYSYQYRDSNNNYSSLPVDEKDQYGTENLTSSLDNGTLNNSSSTLKTSRAYKVYPVRYESQGMPEVQDFNGVTKLIKENFYNTDNNSLYASNEYSYIVEPFYNNARYDGSFLVSNKKSIIQNQLKEYIFEYMYEGGYNQFDSLVTEYVETDPKGNKRYIKSDNFYQLVNINQAVGSYSGETNGTMVFYKSGVPLIEAQYLPGSNPIGSPGVNTLSKKTYAYIDNNNSALGYFGQLISEKVFNQINFSDYIETKFEYYKLDNTGNEIYTAGSLPYKEGNLKKVIKPEGIEEVYFYHPISASENVLGNGGIGGTDDISYPKISYKIKFDNGVDSIAAEYIWDHRLPTRIDHYKRLNGYSVDTLSKVYLQYNAAGMPTKMINENNYLTLITYQPTHRVRSVTMPGDFSRLSNDTTKRIDTNYFYDTVNVTSTGWGHRNRLLNDTLFLFNNPSYLPTCPIFMMHQKYINGQTLEKKGLFIKFENVPKFNIVVSANLVFPVTSYVRVFGNTPMQESQYNTILSTVSSYSNFVNRTCANQSLHEYTSMTVDFIQKNIVIDTSSGGEYKRQNVDVADMIENISTQGKQLNGFYISPQLTGTYGDPLPDHEFLLKSRVFGPWTNWLANEIPKLKIFGKIDASDTLNVVNIKGGTYIYEYNDSLQSVTVHSRLSHSPNKLKKIKYHIDGFGNIKEKDVFTGTEVFDDFNFKFNFMNQPAENIDARGNSTKFTYDYAGRQIKTTNEDDSYSTTAFAYDDELQNYFGTNGPNFVERQQFTDETNRIFYKYFDAVGNLLREEKFVDGGSGGIDPVFDENPYDPDTTYQGQDFPSNMAALTTDYRYDNLYRLVQVKTPNGKNIYYNYDGYGRQSRRQTPDAGITSYSYDNNGNLIHSQDANQRAVEAGLNTKRTYDGLNRLLTISDMKFQGTPTETGPMGDTLLPLEMDSPPNADSVYVVNVYDTISTAVLGIFNNLPADYTAAANYTRGNLTATAYRTLLSDAWGFKFYRYDERGNVIKLWHYIAGLGWKSEMYYLNSQNQLTRNWYQPNQTDGKLFTYGYDGAGRLDYVNQYMGNVPHDPEEEGETDGSSPYFTLAKYSYNQNSQVDTLLMNDNVVKCVSVYNVRNWITLMYKKGGPLQYSYNLDYNANGNIKWQQFQGTYSGSFTSTGGISYRFTYDNSNRLLKADNEVSSNFDLINGYDRDGNFTNMKRYGSSNNLADNFSYSYFSGTNKLRGIDGPSGRDQYTYDANGNMAKDDNNRNHSAKYDHRNLMTEIRSIKSEAGTGPWDPGLVDVLYITIFKYDEAGNRIRKTVEKYEGGDPDPVHENTGDNPGWHTVSDEFYVRDVSGKEIAIYSGSSLVQWNIWGLDNVGKINADTTRNYNLKDHLGSIRAVLNSTNQVISAQDYDAWGYPLENRTYNATAMKYDFTGKERDEQTTYDYFGARYYDSRIGRWGGVEPLLDKYLSLSSYQYGELNPIKIVDFNGKDGIATIKGNVITININVNYSTESTFGFNSVEDQTFLTNTLNEAQMWTEAGQNIEFEGKKYNVEFVVNQNEVSSEDIQEMWNGNSLNDGENIAFQSNSAKDPGVMGDGNMLRLVPELKSNNANEEIIRNFAPFMGAHELGHLLGLNHKPSVTYDIMSYNYERNGPSKENVIEVLKKLDLSKERQVIKGINAEE